MTDGAYRIAIESGYEPVRPDGTPDPNAKLPPPKLRGGKHQLRLHQDVRGGLVELWRQSWTPRWSNADEGDDRLCDEASVRQAYISRTTPGVVKAWHLHPHSQIDRFVVTRGRVLVCTFDLLDPDAKVTERVLDWRTPERLDVPPMHAHGWMALGTEEAWVVNLVSVEYDGTLEWRRAAHQGPSTIMEYNWRRSRDG